MSPENRAQLEALKDQVATGVLGHKEFLESAVRLGVSIEAAYAELDDASGARSDEQAIGGRQGADMLKEALGDQSHGRIVDVTDVSPSEGGGVKERIARLRDRVQRTHVKPDVVAMANPAAWVDWDNDYTRWGDFHNWGNWDNTFGNWDNWGNKWDNA